MTFRPRIRTIKPEMWADEKIGSLSRDARLLFVGLITMADDQGRLRAMPAAIIGHVFPYDDDITAGKLAKLMADLERIGLIVRYEVDSRPYVALVGWSKHQKVNRANASELPAPDTTVSVNGHDSFTEASVNDHGTVTDDARSHAQAGAIADRDRDQEDPPTPQGGEIVKFDRKPVPPARLQLAERVLAEFNRQAGTGYGAYTGRGRPSEDLKRIIGALTDAVPALEFEEAREMTRIALANPKPYWEGKPHTGVVFGPKVIGSLREQAKRQQPRAEGAWSRGFVQAVNGDAA